MELRRAMGLWDLVLFNLTAVISLRWLATAARSGPSSLSVWVLAALFFFLPQGIAVLYLSRRFPEEGGIYRWTRRAFGDFHGFFCGWCYWVSNLVYYPSLLIFAAATAAYILGPQYLWLGEHAWFTSMGALVLLWIAIGANVVGLNIGKWVQNIGGVATWAPGMLLVALGALVYFRSGSANPLWGRALVPAMEAGTLSFWSTIAFAFAGLELAPVMSGEIRDPERNIPRALFISSALVALVYIAGTAAVLVVLPSSEVNVITGPLQTIDAVVRRSGFGSVATLVAVLLTLASVGGTGAWLAGSARIPFAAGIDRFLPAAFGRVHPRWGTPHVAILTQGVMASLFLLLSLPGGTVADTYLLLAELTIIIYFVPYLYLFLSLLRLWREAPAARSFRSGPATGETTISVPGGKAGVWAAGLAGFLATLLSIVVSLIPSAAVATPWLYRVKLIGGTVLFLGAGLLLYRVRSSRIPSSQLKG